MTTERRSIRLRSKAAFLNLGVGPSLSRGVVATYRNEKDSRPLNNSTTLMGEASGVPHQAPGGSVPAVLRFFATVLKGCQDLCNSFLLSLMRTLVVGNSAGRA